MKILKQGTRVEDRWHKGTCLTCLTEVEFQGKEAKRQSGQLDGNYLQVTCPTCSGIISCQASKFQLKPYSEDHVATWKDI